MTYVGLVGSVFPPVPPLPVDVSIIAHISKLNAHEPSGHVNGFVAGQPNGVGQSKRDARHTPVEHAYGNAGGHFNCCGHVSIDFAQLQDEHKIGDDVGHVNTTGHWLTFWTHVPSLGHDVVFTGQVGGVVHCANDNAHVRSAHNTGVWTGHVGDVEHNNGFCTQFPAGQRNSVNEHVIVVVSGKIGCGVVPPVVGGCEHCVISRLHVLSNAHNVVPIGHVNADGQFCNVIAQSLPVGHNIALLFASFVRQICGVRISDTIVIGHSVAVLRHEPSVKHTTCPVIGHVGGVGQSAFDATHAPFPHVI